jgi:hypothetical protein
MMVSLILTAIGFLIYGIYRAARRWGAWVLWLLAAAVCFLDGAGVIAERLWGPAYSWNLSHHTWNSLPSTAIQFLLYLVIAVCYRKTFAR